MPTEACLGRIRGAAGADDGTEGFMQLRNVCQGPSQVPPKLRCARNEGEPLKPSACIAQALGSACGMAAIMGERGLLH